MKFQFCGGVACPEWFLAESSILTKITAIKLKLITANLILFLLDGSDITAKITKLLEGSAFTQSEINALVSTLEFIIRNSIAFNINQVILNKQLVDLGLPKQNVESIVKTYKQNFEKLRQKFVNLFPKYSSTPDISASVSQLIEEGQSINNFVDVGLSYKDSQMENRKCNFSVSVNMLQEMIFSLERAKKYMKQLQSVSTI